ncbi:FMN-linked oxidoreductase [Artomyces pyxidatus]|uniref:FMN-linked oxidoreductase n=1 Tax=Artomyces pyxidatus TaxID=48021 RepID=A0ACB8T6N5_9AGAM|nr:FMN-linked oxidoreductase [Artomyces pyxidatus]
MSSSTPALFQPITIGEMTLKHRIVMAPLTRFRADDQHIMGPMGLQYYEQRAGSASGTFIISEATVIAPHSGGFKNNSVLWSDDQIAGWKKIVDMVHAKGSFIYCQLWDTGAAGIPSIYREDGYPYVGAGDLLFEDHDEHPRPLTVDEIHGRVELYVAAARSAVFEAGFDGVELHALNGYLLDQFLQPNANNRTDEYGGSIENRIRFPLEALDAIVAAVGAKKTAMRLSPWSRFQGMGMPDPVPTFRALVTRIRDTHPDLSYLHVVEPRIDGGSTARASTEGESNDFIREIWGPERRMISAGGFTRESGLETAEKTGSLIAYGRYFIANPDLVRRLKENAPLNTANRATYYGPGPEGYVDYPFLGEESKV